MNKSYIFLTVEFIIIFAAAIVIFRGFKIFFQSLYSAFFRGYYFWSKRLWVKHFEKSIRFEFFLLVAGLLTVINILIFRFIVK